MGYIDQTLGSNEKVLHRAHIHSLFYIRIFLPFAAVAALVGWLGFKDYIGLPFALILLVITAVFCLSFLIPLWTLEFALTNLRLVMKRGFLTRSTHELELKAVEEVNIQQSFLGRLLNYGAIEVRGISDTQDLIFKNIADPLIFRKEIASAMQSANEGTRAVPSTEHADASKAAGQA